MFSDKYFEKRSEQVLRGTNLKKTWYTKWISQFFSGCNMILDVGCGDGSFLSALSLTDKSYGVDISDHSIKICKEKGFRVKKGSILDLPFEESTFEGIFCSHVIEHLSDPEQAMIELRRVLKKNGRVVLVTPDIKRAKWNFFNDYTHKTAFTKRSISELFDETGFKVISVQHGMFHLKGSGLFSILNLQGIQLSLCKFLSHYFSKDLLVYAVKS